MNTNPMRFNWGSVVDLSPFVLVEASGDSEAPSDSDREASGAAHEDDAESCACGPCDAGTVEEEEEEEERGMGGKRIFRGDVIRVCRELEDDDGDEEGEVCSSIIHQKKKRRRRRSHEKASELEPAPEKCRKRNGGNGDSKKKEGVMNEMERNKLFWESCLAS